MNASDWPLEPLIKLDELKKEYYNANKFESFVRLKAPTSI
jgi:hypothetical protein